MDAEAIKGYALRLRPAPAFEPQQIVRIRLALGLSQSLFAAALNVRTGTVSAWEQGSRRPAGAALRLIQFAEASPDGFSAYMRLLSDHVS